MITAHSSPSPAGGNTSHGAQAAGFALVCATKGKCLHRLHPPSPQRLCANLTRNVIRELADSGELLAILNSKLAEFPFPLPAKCVGPGSRSLRRWRPALAHDTLSRSRFCTLVVAYFQGNQAVYGFTDLPPSLPLLPGTLGTRNCESSYRWLHSSYKLP